MMTPASDSLLASAAALRPRSASELVDAAFQLVRRHFVPLLAVGMLVWFPIALMQQLGAHLGSIAPAGAAMFGATIFVVTAVWYAVGSAMLARVAADAYMGEGARPVVALRAALARTWDICVSTFVAWVVIAAGLFLIALLFGMVLAALPDAVTGRLWVALPLVLVILALMTAWTGYFTAYYFAVPAACAIDGLDFSDALKRSRRLSEGQKRHILAAMFWPYLIASIPFIGFLIAVAIFPSALAVMQVVWHALTVAALPLVGAVTAVVYMDARVRRDGLDLEVMAQALSPSPDRTAANPPVQAPPAGMHGAA